MERSLRILFAFVLGEAGALAFALTAIVAGCETDRDSGELDAPPESGAQKGRSSGDSTTDGEREPDRVLEMRVEAGKQRVEVYRADDGSRGFLVVGRGREGWTSPVYPMWRVERGDVDGDGDAEPILGIWIHEDRNERGERGRTIWVLDWRDGRLYERWRGSGLARPLRNFDIERRKGRSDLLVALERGSDVCWRTRYKWTGFGFSGVDKESVECGRDEVLESE